MFFVGKRPAQREQLAEQLVDGAAPRVVRLDQILELLDEVHPGAIRPHHAVELRANRRLEASMSTFLVPRLFLLEPLRKPLEVDGRQVDHMRAVSIPDGIAARGNRAVENTPSVAPIASAMAARHDTSE
jgi:hypothetical protein